MPIKKYQLFLHHLNTEAWVLFFVKKKLMPTRYDSTISLDKPMPLYCIIQEIPINVGKIICKHIHSWVKHPCDTRPFPHLIKELCLQLDLALKKYPRTAIEDEIWTMVDLNHMINLFNKKVEEKHFKTQNKETCPEGEEMKVEDETEEEEGEKQSPFICKRKGVDEASRLKKEKKKTQGQGV